MPPKELVQNHIIRQVCLSNESVIRWKGLPLWGEMGKGFALHQKDSIGKIAAY
jgi:hypothetical protein